MRLAPPVFARNTKNTALRQTGDSFRFRLRGL